MSRKLVILIAAALAAHAGTDQQEPELDVRIRNDAEVPPSMLKAALSIVVKTYRKAGVRLVWRECSARQGCAEKVGPEARILVLSTAESVAQWSPAPGELGRALLRESCGQGRIAYIFESLVARRAAHAVSKLDQEALYSRLLYHRLLGYAMAHELAHLLGASHGDDGLMAAAWDTDTLDEIRRGALALGPDQAKQILDSATKRYGCLAD